MEERVKFTSSKLWVISNGPLPSALNTMEVLEQLTLDGGASDALQRGPTALHSSEIYNF
jgi:hypothetical protein